MVLEVLGDGKWHGIEDTREQMDFNFEEMGEIVDFLGKYGFAEEVPERNKEFLKWKLKAK